MLLLWRESFEIIYFVKNLQMPKNSSVNIIFILDSLVTKLWCIKLRSQFYDD